MTNFKWPEFDNFDLPKHTVLLGLTGSRSYGTDNEHSDTDWKGLCIRPKALALSPYRDFEQHIWQHPEEDEEGCIFSLRKFFINAAVCNPNFIELLYVDERHIVKNSNAGILLRAHRDEFLSQRAAKTFCGYGMSQLKRIKTHREWLLNPMKNKPVRADYNLPEMQSLSGSQLQAVNKFVRRNMHTLAPWLVETDNTEREAFWESVVNLVAIILDDEGYKYDEDRDNWFKIEEEAAEAISKRLSFDTKFTEYLREEKKYGQQVSQWTKYQGWLRNRNPARAELESKYGYDCKHAMHLVRLLRMGEELATTGKMHVLRPDAEELKDIRNGQWSYDQLIEWATTQQDLVYDAARSPNCPLPKKPNQAFLENLYLELVEDFWNV